MGLTPWIINVSIRVITSPLSRFDGVGEGVSGNRQEQTSDIPVRPSLVPPLHCYLVTPAMASGEEVQ